MTPVGTKILRIEYQDRTGQSLDAALSGTGHIGYLNRDEQTTADQLLRGEGVAGAAGALHSALEGLGTNTDAIRQVCRARCRPSSGSRCSIATASATRRPWPSRSRAR